MKIALIHDYLNQWGGGERVLQVLTEMFPQADIYTLLYDQQKLGGHFLRRNIKTSFLDFSFMRKNHRLFIPLMPLATEFLKLKSHYDLIISDSAGFAKGIAIPKGIKHISYCHSPLRYAWETEYISSKFKSFKFISSFAWPILKYLRMWDYQAAQKPNLLIANSKFIAEKIKKYYKLDAPVLYPPIDTDFWAPIARAKKENYFLAVGRLMHYKKFDLIIDSFNKLKLPLKIVGTGPEEKRLRKIIISPNIEFCGSVTDEELRILYNGAQALIFPQVEDFGLVAAEAIACGTPVVAYAAGGALEIVKNGENGVLFNEQTSKSLSAAIQLISLKRWGRAAIAKSAEEFSLEYFKIGITEAIKATTSPRL